MCLISIANWNDGSYRYRTTLRIVTLLLIRSISKAIPRAAKKTLESCFYVQRSKKISVLVRLLKLENHACWLLLGEPDNSKQTRFGRGYQILTHYHSWQVFIRERTRAARGWPWYLRRTTRKFTCGFGVFGSVSRLITCTSRAFRIRTSSFVGLHGCHAMQWGCPTAV